MTFPGSQLRELFREPDFVRLWSIGALTMTMRWMEILVIGVYTFEVSGSAMVVAVMLFVRTCPGLFLGAFAGAIVERLDRRHVLAAALIISVASVATLGAIAVLGEIELWQIACGAFLNGLFWSLEFPTRRTLLGDVAGLPRIGAAMGFDSATSNATRVLGPVIGGSLYESCGLAGPYFVGVLIYAIAIFNTLTLRYRSKTVEATDASVLTILRQGIAYIRSNRLLTGALVVTVLVNFFGTSYTSMVPVIGGQKFGLSAFPIGVMVAMEGLGAMFGGILIAFVCRPPQFARVYLYGSYLYIAMIAVFSLAPGFAFSLPSLLLGGLGMAGFGAMQSALIFSVTEPRMRRRVMGVLVVCIGASPLGVLHTGLLAEWLGADIAIRVVALEGLAALSVCFWRWPELGRLSRFEN